MLDDASHFSMVGFDLDVRDPAAFTRDLAPFVRTCQPREFAPNELLCRVKDPSGGELLISLHKTGRGGAEMVTVNPAFDGEGRATVTIDGDVSDPEWKTFERAYSAHFEAYDTPVVFELSDPEQASLAKHGQKVTVEIAAFSFDLKVFPDAAAFQRDQKDKPVQWSDAFFVPSGMFNPDAGGAAKADRPTPYADFAGTVIKSELRTNLAGGGRFWWALVSGFEGATFDVVIDPDQIDGPVKTGAVLTGRFWLTARIVQP